MSDVTHFLYSVGQGNPSDAEELLNVVDSELPKLAAQKMAEAFLQAATAGDSALHSTALDFEKNQN